MRLSKLESCALQYGFSVDIMLLAGTSPTFVLQTRFLSVTSILRKTLLTGFFMITGRYALRKL